jgi:hypothetical protein
MDRPPLRVFISYTAEDLHPFADIVVDVVQRLEWVPVDHRKWSPSGRPSVDECRKRVANADILVVLVAHRYGWVPTPDEGGDGRTSITWLEVKWARGLRKEVIPYIVRPDAPWHANMIEGLEDPDVLPHLNAFKDDLRRSLTGFFSQDPGSLLQSLEGALRDAAERIWSREVEARSSLAVEERRLGPVTPGTDASQAATRSIQLVIPSDAGHEHLTFKLARSLLAGGLVIEIVTEAEQRTEEKRDGAPAAETIEVADDDILALELQDRSTHFVTARDYHDQLAGHAPPGSGATGGGLGSVVLRALSVLKIADSDTFAASGAREIARALESKVHPGPGVYRFSDPAAIGDAVPAPGQVGGERPFLLFLHGPCVRNADTFRSLRTNAAWDALRAAYGERLLAFEHETIAVSPIANALALARWTPSGAALHLISHSTGGLVAELLCLPPSAAQDPGTLLAPLQTALMAAQNAARRRAIEEDIENLRELASLVCRKRWRIARFLRVACPARGVAASRLDQYLSLLLNLADARHRSGELSTTPVSLLKALTLSVVKHRIAFDDLPGLAAMQSSAPLIAILNDPRWTTHADLNVVGGAVTPRAFLQWALLLSTDAFYGEEGDRLIPRASLSGGLRRPQPAPYWEEGRTSFHFDYFDDKALCRRIGDWLTVEPRER